MLTSEPRPPPAGFDALIGRDRDPAALLEEISNASLVSLTGAGGSGKTRLAAAAIASLRGRGYPAWMVDLSSVEDSSFVGPAISAALRLESLAPRDALALIVDALGE